jgi:predicted nucleic acid-binding protein
LGGRGRWISEFQDSQGYTEKPCLKKIQNPKKEKKKKKKVRQEFKQDLEVEP